MQLENSVLFHFNFGDESLESPLEVCKTIFTVV